MKQIDTNAWLRRWITKHKSAFRSTALALFGLSAFSLQAQAQALLDEDFTGGTLPTGWTNVVNTGGTAGNVWEFDNPGQRNITGADFDTDFAIIDSDEYGNGNTQNTTLTTAAFDASTVTGTLMLSFSNQLRECCGALPM